MVNIPRADKSGAEVTVSVQTLREFRRRLNFAKRPGGGPPRFSTQERLFATILKL
jgi:hypothetical protein